MEGVSGQNPIRWRKVEESIDVRRRVFCKYYGDCLNLAITKSWPGFSCEACPVREMETQLRSRIIRSSMSARDIIEDFCLE